MNFKRVVALALLGFLLLGAGSATVSAQTIEDINETYGGGDLDSASSVVQTEDGGYALAGSTKSFGSGDFDAWLVKTDSNGNVEFTKTFGGSSSDFGSSVVQTEDGGFALGGTSYSSEGSGDAWLIKTDENGTEEFSKTFGGADSDIGSSVVQTDDGGYALAGRTESFGTGGSDDMWLIKTYPNGTEEFSKTFHKLADDDANSVVQTDDGGFALGGTRGWFEPDSDAILIKTYPNGTEEFTRAFDSSVEDETQDSINSVIQTSDGGFALAGTEDSTVSNGDAWLIKTDENGIEQFTREFGGVGPASASSVVQTDDDGFALAGSFPSEDDIYDNLWLIKTDSNGFLQFDQRFDRADDSSARSIVQTEDGDGSLALAGRAAFKEVRDNGAIVTTEEDAWLLKVIPTQITSCRDISEPGYYRLTEDIIDSSAPSCINITSSDVVLDGQGHRVDGVADSGSVGINVDDTVGLTTLTNVTVKNVDVTEWDYGIRYELADGGNITGNSASSNFGSGIYLDSSSNITVANNDPSSNLQNGIHLDSSSNNTLTNNNANSNFRDGIHLDSSSNNNLSANEANDNTQHGIHIISSNDNNVSENTANSNTENGILLVDSTGNRLTDNGVDSNLEYGIRVSASNNNYLSSNDATQNDINGIELRISDSNTISANTATGNGFSGIGLVDSNENEVRDNTAESNSVGIDIVDESDGNEVTDNEANSNDASGIRLDSSSGNNVSANNANGNTFGISLGSSSDNNFLTKNDVDDNAERGISIDSSSGNKVTSNTARNNFRAFFSDNIPPGRGIVEEVNETYGGTDIDEARSVIETDDGGFAIAGETKSFGAGDTDAWLIKTDSNGNEVFNKPFGGIGADRANSVVQTDDGGFVIAGETTSFGSGSDDAWLIKTDSNGNEVFNKTFGGANSDVTFSVVQTTDGGFALAGWTNSFGSGSFDAWLIKTDSNGNEVFNKTFGGADLDRAFSMVQTDDGGFALGGTTRSFSTGGTFDDAWLIKTDENGNVEINETFGGADDDNTFSVVQTDDGGFALGGRTRSFGSGSFDAWLIKTDDSGNVNINKTFGGADSERAWSVVRTVDGGFALGGRTHSFGSGGDMWLVKTDEDGNEQINKTYGGSDFERARSVVQTDDGGFALGGQTRSFGSGNDDAWLLKVSKKGNSVRNLDIGASTNPGTTVTFEESKDITLKSVENPPDDPFEVTNIGRYVEITNNSADSFVNLTVNYDDTDALNVEEPSLSLWRNNGMWSEVSGSTLDTTNNNVSANLTSFSIFAPLGNSTGLVSSCRDITSPGTYRLTTDLTDRTEQSCIDITTSDVVFDGEGHTVDGLDDSGTVGVNVTDSSTLTNVTVRSVTVTNWGNGIRYEDADDGNITDNDATSNTNGISLDSSRENNVSANNATSNTNDGVQLSSSSNNNFTDNNASDNGRHGIFLSSSSDNNDLSANEVTGNDQHGISLELSGSNSITTNDADSNRQGIRLFLSNSNTLSANNVSGNELDGIFLAASTGNTISVNNATSNGRGIFLSSSDSNIVSANNATGNSAGIRLTSSSNNDVTDNEANSNTFGIGIASSSSNNTLTNNTARNNSDFDFSSESDSVDNTVRNLDIGTSTNPDTTLTFGNSKDITLKSVDSPPSDPAGRTNIGRYVEATNLSTDSFVNLTMNYDDADVPSDANETSLSLWRNDGSWSEVSGSTLDTVNNNVSANLTSFSIFAPLANSTGSDTSTGSGITSCTDITSPGTYKLATDLTDRPEKSCINITTSDVIFDGQGHTVDGINGFDTRGINVTGSSTLTNVTVRNVTVKDWENGIRYEDTDGGNISDNYATSNTRDGIRLFESSGVKVTDNDAVSNERLGIAIISSTSNNNTIAGNNATSNAAGINIVGDDNEIKSNNVSSNGNDGITIASANNNNVTNNDANENGEIGVSVSGSNHNVWANNASGNGNDGIRIAASDSNVWANNASGNTNGFFFFSATGNTLTNNTARNNDDWDFFSEFDSADNTVRNLDIGVSTNPETTISFSNSKDIALKSVDSPPSNPSGASNIGRYVDITDNSADSFVNLTMNYEDADVSDVDESSLSLWRNDGSWSEVSGSTVDTVNNNVSADIDSFSIFAPLGSNIVNSCVDITSSGAYKLTTDLTDRPEKSCINITASNVVFDGQGHTVDGVDDTGTIGVNVTSSSTLTNVTVRNVTVTDWEQGILYEGVDDGNITDNNVTSNRGNGILFKSSNNNDVTGNNANSNERRGIELRQSSGNNDIIDNDASGNRFAGVLLQDSSDDNDLINNNMSANDFLGIDLGFSSGTNVSDNDASGNGRDGIDLVAATNNNVTGNKLTNNERYGIAVLQSSDNNNVTGNNATANRRDGIVLRQSSNNTFTNNTARNNDDWGFSSDRDSTDNIVRNLDIGMSTNPDTTLTFKESKDIALKSVDNPPNDPSGLNNISRYVEITDNSADSFVNLTVQYEDSDVTSDVIEGSLSIWKNDGSWSELSGSTVDTTRNEVSANITSFSIFAPLGAGFDVTSCRDIVAPGEYRLTTDLMDRPEKSCINVTSSDVIFDGQGHTVDGLDDTGTIGVNVTSSSTLTNITIRNVTTTDWGDGILYDGADEGEIIDNNASGNDDNGISLRSESDNNDVTSNKATGNGADGIQLRGGSKNNNVTDNNVSANSDDGISLTTSFKARSRTTNNNVADNKANSNNVGISLSSSSGNTILNNSASGNDLQGIRLGSLKSSGSSKANTIQNNNASGNGADGISLDSSVGNNILANNASGNDDNGILLTSSSKNDVISNNASGNRGKGIHLRGGSLGDDSDFNNVTGNHVTSNDDDGISLLLSSDNVLMGNKVSSNDNGIEISTDSGDNTLTDNTAKDNGGFDYSSVGAPANNVVRNLDIGTSTNPDTTLTFEESEDITISSVDSPPSDPSGEKNIGRYVEINANNPDSFVDLTVNYEDSDIPLGVLEGSLSIWKNDGSWSEVSGSTVDTTNNEVSASITSFSVFAPLGNNRVNSCIDITSPGKYKLTKDLTNRPEKSCVNITSSKVVFDGREHTVDGVDSPGSVGINVTNPSQTINNVVVRNVTATDWGDGIQYDDADNGDITDNNVTSNEFDGIRLLSSNSNEVADNNVTSNGREGIILDLSSNNNTVTGNNASSNTEDGIRLSSSSDNNKIIDNDANSNNDGIVLTDSSNNTVTGNNASSNNGGNGVFFLQSDNNNVTDNNASSNGFPGIVVGSSSGNKLTNNNASSNGFSGFLLDSSSDNTLINNTARNNENWGFFSDSVSIDNTVRNLDIGMSTNPETTLTFEDSKDIKLKSVDSPPSDPVGVNNIGRYVEINGNSPDSFVELAVNYEDSDIPAGVAEGSLSIWKNDGSWSELSGSTVDTTRNEVSANITSFSIFAPLGTRTKVSSCRDIVAPGEYRLTTDLMDRPEKSCINVTSSDVIFDGQGHTVDGLDDTGTIGVNVTSSSTLTNITIRNITVTNWDTGVRYSDINDGNVTDSNATSNVGNGVDITSSSGIDVTSNNASENDLNGIFLDSSSDNNVTGNQASSNGRDGILLRESNSNNHLKDNNATRNDNNGIRLRFSDNNTISTNNASGNSDGIHLVSSTDNDVVGNDANSNNLGILIVSLGGNNVSMNDASGNDFEGVRLVLSNSNNIKTNNMSENDQYGIRLFSSSDNTLTNNTARNNGDGDFESRGDSVNNTVHNLEIGTSMNPDTTLTFEDSKDIRLKSVGSPPSDPAGEKNIGRYVEITNNSADSFVNLTVNYNDSDVPSGITEESLDIWRNNGTWSELSDSTVDTTNNEASANITSFSVFAPLGNSRANSCVDITSPGKYELTTDLIDRPEKSCINITTSDVIFDGQGHTVDGVDDPASIGVNVTGSSPLTNVTVRNVTVTDWGDGIRFDDVDDSNVTDSNARSNRDGVELSRSSGNNVSGNDADSNVRNGIRLGSSDDNTVTDNNATSSMMRDGIVLESSSGNNVSGNDVSSNAEDGINVSSASDANKILDNDVTDNTGTGIDVTGSVANEMERNVVSNNRLAGIRLTDSGASLLADNIVTGNNAAGDATLGGIVLESSSSNFLSNNTARNNDIWDYRSSSLSGNNTAEDLDIGASTDPDTTLDFEAKNVELTDVSSPPADPGGNEQNISRYVNATNTSTSSYLNLTFRYTDADVSNVAEQTLAVWKFNGTWTELPSNLDTAANTVSTNITGFSVFAPLGKQAGGGPPGDVPGFGDECRRDRDRQSGDCPSNRDIGRGQGGSRQPKRNGGR